MANLDLQRLRRMAVLAATAPAAMVVSAAMPSAAMPAM
jgi:hypothetical protein